MSNAIEAISEAPQRIRRSVRGDQKVAFISSVINFPLFDELAKGGVNGLFNTAGLDLVRAGPVMINGLA